MKARAWPGRKTVVRLAAIAPQPEAAPGGTVRQAWRSSLQRRSDGDEGLVSGSTPGPEGSPAFELVSLQQLPAFDASKTLKTVLLTPDQIRRLNEFRIRWRSVIAVLLQLGNLLMLLTTAAPRRLGSVMAVLAPILQFPGMALIMGSVRIEMLYLLCGTYDFWYFTVNNLVFGVCFIAMLQDVRILVVLVGCLIVQISIGADALVGDRKQLFLSSVINCGTHFAMLAAVFLKLVDDGDRGNTFLLAFSSSGYGFSIRDTLMNSQFNMVLLFGRLVYRNWVAVREQQSSKARRINSQTSYIPGRRRCVSYYCTVGLRLKYDNVQRTILRAHNTSSITRFSTTATTEDGRSTRSRAGSVLSIQALESYHTRAGMSSVGAQDGVKGRIDLQSAQFDPHHRRRTRIQSNTKIQLQFAPISKEFNAYKTLVPGFGRLLDRMLGSNARTGDRNVLLDVFPYVFHAVGYLGIGGLVLGALAAWLSKDQNLDNIRPGLARTPNVAFFASLAFCGVFFASYQRQLLTRLYSSFNFLFLSTKLTVASLALCQFFGWDRRVVWVWGAWLWMQWAITLDALPPSTTRLLAFRRSTLMLSVLLFELAGLVILSLELFAFDRWIVSDRAVVERVVLGRHIRVSTLSALASRLLTIFLWDCKLIWFLTASLRRQRRRRMSAVDTDESHEDDEGQRLLLTGRVEYFYELASHTRPRDAQARWSKGLQVLRFLRRRTRAKLDGAT